MFVNRFFLILSVGVLGSVAGCGGQPTLDVAVAKGRLTIDGSPASGVTIAFVPQDGVKGRGGYAMTDSEGRFSAKASADQEGVVPGNYRTLFSKVVMPDGSPIPPDAMAADVDAKNVLHPVYSDPAQSPMTVTVPESGSENLELQIQTRPLL